MDLFGFIITRHVNSEKTNNYWNHSVKLIRTFYPFIKICNPHIINIILLLSFVAFHT